MGTLNLQGTRLKKTKNSCFFIMLFISVLRYILFDFFLEERIWCIGNRLPFLFYLIISTE